MEDTRSSFLAFKMFVLSETLLALCLFRTEMRWNTYSSVKWGEKGQQKLRYT